MRLIAAPLQRARRFCSTIAFVAVALLLGLAADAAAQGSISGRVTSSTTGNGLAGSRVWFFGPENEELQTTTDSMGFYTMNLAPGDWGVVTNNSDGYINEAWQNVQCSATCNVNLVTPITVTTTAITNINFVLDPGARISGTVTSQATGLPIANVLVMFLDSDQQFGFTTAVTNAMGQYVSDGGTVAGTIYACTLNSVGFQDEAYNDVKSPGCNTPGQAIPVTLAGVTGIDFALDPGGQITGTITGIDGAPLVDVEVHIQTSTSDTYYAFTDAAGHYASAGLPAGIYYVNTQNALGLADKLYNGIYCAGAFCNPASGTPINVATIGTVVNGIDLVLPPGGRIGGTITNAVGGAPIEDVFIGISDAFGNFVGGTNSREGGVFLSRAVPPGVYYANVSGVAGFLHQNYNNLPCLMAFCPATAGTPIIVSTNATTSGINFALVPTTSSGGISGTVTSVATGLAVANAQVQLVLTTGQQFAAVNTDASGNYAFTGLAPGSYFVRTNSGGTLLINEIYNDIVCVACNATSSGANPIVVTAGVTTTGINFALATGGRLQGTITNAAGGAPIQGLGTQVFNTAGVQMGTGSTNASGVYSSFGLPPGAYYIRTSAPASLGFVNELYNNVPCPGTGCNPLAGAPITVTANTTTPNINFALDAGGRISGTVTNGTSGLPVQGVNVQIFNVYGVNLGNAPATDASGAYTSPALPAGTYYVRTANAFGLSDELYNNITCLNNIACPVTSGTPVVVANGATTGNINFALLAGTGISGRVTDANTALGITNVQIQIYDSLGVIARTAATNALGQYVVGGLPPGTYYARTSVLGSTLYADELYDGSLCMPTCTVTAGTPIVISAGAATTVTGVDFALAPGGGAVTGTVTDAVTGVPIPAVLVQIHDNTGAMVKFATTSAAGVFSVSGLPAGTYYGRTALTSASNYADELYGNKPWPCVPSCAVTTGTAIVVVAGATLSGVDFSLAPNLAQNGQFLNGTGTWSLFATPDMTFIQSNVTNGVFQFARVTSPGNQAVIFQNTGLAVGANVALMVRFDLGNTDTVRKRISVLVQDSDFLDLSVCTFWLPASAPIRTYAIRTHTTKAWANATVAFYAATPGTGGFYQLDNVSVHAEPSVSTTETMCVDPTVPVPPGGVDGPTILQNGDFSSGTVAPGWGLFGQINGSVTSGVFQFIKLAGSPAGVILQPTSQPMNANQLMTASFQLGNSSAVRKRVTVILHDNDFSDLSACTFWLAPGQPLSNYTYRTFATRAWTNATLSVYPATVGSDQWIRLDNVSLRRTPSAAITGTECLEPGSSPDVGSDEWSSATPPSGAGVAVPIEVEIGGARARGFQTSDETAPAGGRVWTASAIRSDPQVLELVDPLDLTDATSAHVRFQSWLTVPALRAAVEVSTDGVTWAAVQHAAPSDTWTEVSVDLRGYLGTTLFVRFVFAAEPPSDAGTPAAWRIGDVSVDVEEAGAR